MASSTLELPQFKGTPGWEFTDISKLDLGAFAPGEPVDAPPAIFDMPANAAPLEEHELLGSVVTKEDAFTVRNRESWTHGALVHVPAGERLEEPVVIRAGVGDALEWRTLIVLEDGAEAEVWEEWVSGDDETEGLFNGVTEIVARRGRDAALRRRAGAERLDVGVREPARGRRARRDARLVRARASARCAARCGWRRSSTARARRRA